MAEPVKYRESVNYAEIDPFKVSAIEAAATTGQNLERFGYQEVPGSRGESAFVWDDGDRKRAGVIEGLGTKNLAADAVDAQNPEAESHYGSVAQCALGTMINDLIACGAKPQIVWTYVAAGESRWFTDEKRSRAFNQGIAAVCNKSGITWAGGESPVLRGMILPGASEIAGFLLGEINPRERHITGDRLEAGDAIILVASSGLHANGYTSTRELAGKLPDGYQTKISDDLTFGEALLQPTNLYSDMVQALLDRGIDIKRLENITGHGWSKLMRAPQPFTHRMHDLPPTLPIFKFLRDNLPADDAEMFGTYNMNAGYAVYTPKSEVKETIACINDCGLDAWDGGTVETGPRQVIIEPLQLILKEDTLGIRV